MSTGWRRGDLLLAGGLTVALAASADTAWSLHARFALDLEGLSALERAGVALWDFRPLATAVFAGAAVAVLVARDGEGPWGGLLAVLAGAQAALGLVVSAAAVVVAASGSVGSRDELGFSYSADERVVTLVTQLAAWLPLAVLLAAVAVLAARQPSDRLLFVPEGAPGAPAAGERSLAAEMEALWEARLAHGPRRERARALLARIRSLEEAGDHEGASELAEEMRGL